MKKVYAVIAISAFFTTIFASKIFAEYVSTADNSLNMYQSLNQGAFFMYGDWLSADSFTAPIGGTAMTDDVTGNQVEFTITPFYFHEFDYTPDVNINLLELVSANTYSVPGEGPVLFQVKYCDAWNEPSADYPSLTLVFPDSSSKTYTLKNSGGGDIYGISINDNELPKGVYEYTYSATNAEYLNAKGIYKISGNWYVTSRPSGFTVRTPPDLPFESNKVLPVDVKFEWSVFTDESNDILSYDFYLGTTPSKSGLVKYSTAQAVNVSGTVVSSLLVHELNSIKHYYWYMRVTNKYGAYIEAGPFQFYTGGMVDQFYNAPNPFRPLKQSKTTFVFGMPHDGTAKLVLYSEYGDKVWESDTVFVTGGNSGYIDYNGRDNSGKMLYNGSYLAVLTKKYSGTTKIEKCRILIVK